MIRRISEASRSNIYKFSEVLELISMKKIVSKRDDFMVNALLYLSQSRDLRIGVMYSVLGFPVIERAREFCNNWKRDICFCSKFS